MYLPEFYQSLSDREMKEVYKECDSGLKWKKEKSSSGEMVQPPPCSTLALELLSLLASAMPFTCDVIQPLSL